MTISQIGTWHMCIYNFIFIYYKHMHNEVWITQKNSDYSNNWSIQPISLLSHITIRFAFLKTFA